MSETLTVDIGALSAGVRRALREIAEKRGAERPLTLDDVVQLRDTAKLGERAYSEGGTEDSAPADVHLDAAVGIPGAVLHRPTYGCHLRLMRTDEWEIPERWREWPAEWTTLVRAFVLAHAYDEAACSALADEAQARRVIEAWGASLDATPAETAAAVHRLMREAYPPVIGEKKKGESGTGRKVSRPSYAVLCRRLGVRAGTGSGTCRRRTSAGCCGKSTGGTAARPNRPGTGAGRRWIRKTRGRRRDSHGADSYTD